MSKPFVPNDYFARKARARGLLARSAFKLEEIIKKFPVLAPGQAVLDLGAAPGSWLQVASQAVGAEGRLVGVDITPIKFRAANVSTLTLDILETTSPDQLQPLGPFDVILSDLAPKTTGIRDRDQALSLALDQQVVNWSKILLKPGGNVVIKIFQSPDTARFLRQIKTLFKKVHIYKPQSSRDRSFEIYIIALHKID